MSDLADFARYMLEPAKALMMAGQDLMPTLIFDAPDKGGGIAGVPDYGNDQHKAAIRAGLAALLKEKNATRYVFIMEAWMGTQKMGEPLPEGYRPKNDPQRKEAIVASAADDTGQTVVLVSFITRNPLRFSEPEVLPINTGPLLELLSTPTMN